MQKTAILMSAGKSGTRKGKLLILGDNDRMMLIGRKQDQKIQLFNFISHLYNISIYLKHMNSINSMITWQNLYSNLLINVQQLKDQLDRVDQENLQLGEALANQILIQQQLNQSLQEQNTRPRQHLQSEIPLPEPPQQTPKHERKTRRNKQESYDCPYDQCERVYKSAISLNLHIKLNHKGGTKKQREAYAKQLLDSEEGLCPEPTEKLNLPPGFLQQFRRNYEYCKKYNM